MAKLTTKARKNISNSQFGVPSKAPGSGSYPIPDKVHAANAKARASQMVKRGKLSTAAKAVIDAKANKVLGKKNKK
jgi:hypothetical protein